MIRQVPFSEALWFDIVEQPEQSRGRFEWSVIPESETFAFVDDTGHCIAAGGIYSPKVGTPVAWAMIGADAGPYLAALALKARRILKPYPVVRAGALCGFDAASRLLHLLGFKPTGKTFGTSARVYDMMEKRDDQGIFAHD